PNWSVPWPSAVQALGPAAATKVQVKVVEAPAARVEAPPVNRPVQTPPPVTLTPVRLVVPVFVSVTVTVTLVPAGTSPLGTTLSRCRLVDVVRPVVEPAACSLSVGAGFPWASVATPSAVQALGPATAVKVQVKSCVAPTGNEATLDGVKPPAQLPPPTT